MPLITDPVIASYHEKFNDVKTKDKIPTTVEVGKTLLTRSRNRLDNMLLRFHRVNGIAIPFDHHDQIRFLKLIADIDNYLLHY